MRCCSDHTTLVRTKQPLQRSRGTGIRRTEFLLHAHTEDPPQNPKLLVSRCRLQGSEFAETRRSTHPLLLTDSPTQILLDLIGIDFDELPFSEFGFQVLQCHYICPMGLRCTNGWLRIVVQKKVHPLVEHQMFTPPNRLQSALVSGLQSFAQSALRFMPIVGVRRLHAPSTITVPVAHPPTLAATSLVKHTIM